MCLNCFIEDFELESLGATFKTIGRALEQSEFDALRDDIRYVCENNRKIMRRAGIATAVASVISVVTGIALGLKRMALDLEAEAKKEEHRCL